MLQREDAQTIALLKKIRSPPPWPGQETISKTFLFIATLGHLLTAIVQAEGCTGNSIHQIPISRFSILQEQYSLGIVLSRKSIFKEQYSKGIVFSRNNHSQRIVILKKQYYCQVFQSRRSHYIHVQILFFGIFELALTLSRLATFLFP